MHEILLSEEVLQSIAKYKRSDVSSFKKIQKLLEELHHHPRTGTGKPEALKGQGGDVYSRRINKKDRLIYQIYEEEVHVHVISIEGHYGGK